MKLSYTIMASVIRWFSKTGALSEQTQSKKLGSHTRCQMQKLASKNKCMSAASIAAEVAEVGGQTDRAKIIWDIVQQLGLHGRPSR